MRPLANFTTRALLDELAQRKNGAKYLKRPRRWCDDCVNWRYSRSESDTANNCTKDHEMSFMVPEDCPIDGEWGFYRRGCRDWCRRPDPVPPPPSIPPEIPRIPRAPGGSRTRAAT